MSISNTVTKLRKRERIRSRASINVIAFSEMCLALNDERYSRKELAEHCGIVQGTVRNWLDSLRARKLVYICEYRRDYDQGQPTEVFTWGYLKHDVERPPPKTQKEYSEKSRAKKLLQRTMYGIGNKTSEESSGDLP